MKIFTVQKLQLPIGEKLSEKELNTSKEKKSRIALILHVVLFLILVGLILWILYYYSNSEETIVDECPNVPEAQRTSHLWEISSEKLNTKSYLFGTNHIHYEAVWDSISPTVKDAIFNADVIGLERASGHATSPYINCYFLENNKTLKDVLNLEVYANLEQYLKKVYDKMIAVHPRVKIDPKLNAMVKDTLFSRFLHLKPFYFYLMFSAFIQQFKESMTFQAKKIITLDNYLEYLAKQNNKTLVSIETEESRCNSDLAEIKEMSAIFNYLPEISFDDIKTAQANSLIKSSETVQRYRCGILRPPIKTINDRFQRFGFIPKDENNKKEIDSINRLITRIEKGTLENRNLIMALKIHEFLTKDPNLSFVFAAGQDHYTEQYNVREILEKSYGYKITEVKDMLKVTKLPAIE